MGTYAYSIRVHGRHRKKSAGTPRPGSKRKREKLLVNNGKKTECMDVSKSSKDVIPELKASESGKLEMS